MGVGVVRTGRVAWSSHNFDGRGSAQPGQLALIENDPRCLCSGRQAWTGETIVRPSRHRRSRRSLRVTVCNVAVCRAIALFNPLVKRVRRGFLAGHQSLHLVVGIPLVSHTSGVYVIHLARLWIVRVQGHGRCCCTTASRTDLLLCVH